jgi:arylsulfatase A-like enzyme
MIRRLALFLIALTCLSIVSPAVRADAVVATKRRKPNVIIILTDDQGYSDLSCYGSTRIKTPRVDQMAAEGIRFTDLYAGASVCTPSRAALLTGCYPIRVGMGEFPLLPNGKPWQTRVLFRNAPFGLNPQEMTIPKLLKSAGYATAAIGKWHLGDQKPFLPTNHGFDSYFGILYTPDMPPLDYVRNEAVVERDIDLSQVAQRYTEESLKFIRDNKDGPFFLYFAHTYPHVPLAASKAFKGTSARGLYGDACEEIDSTVGRVLDLLKELKIDDNTLVIFTSDNGPWLAKGEDGGSARPFRGGKGGSYEGGFRMPFIMRYPGVIPPGSVCHEMATQMDLLPTIARLAGVTPPTNIDGKDITDLMLAKPGAKTPHDSFFYYVGDRLHAVRSGKWKLKVPTTLSEEYAGYLKIENPETVIPRALYDLENDPAEQKSVLADHPDVAKRLQAMIESAREDLGDSKRKMKGKNVRPVGRLETLEPVDGARPIKK